MFPLLTFLVFNWQANSLRKSIGVEVDAYVRLLTVQPEKAVLTYVGEEKRKDVFTVLDFDLKDGQIDLAKYKEDFNYELLRAAAEDDRLSLAFGLHCMDSSKTRSSVLAPLITPITSSSCQTLLTAIERNPAAWERDVQPKETRYNALKKVRSKGKATVVSPAVQDAEITAAGKGKQKHPENTLLQIV